MRRYYFDFRDADHLTEDHSGKLLAGDKAAQREAQYALGAMLRRVSGSAMHRVLAIEVRDEGRRPLFRANLTFEIGPFAKLSFARRSPDRYVA